MSNFGDHPAGFFGVSGFYNGVATQSLRFDSASSTRLQKTPNASSLHTWTWAGWVKRSKLGVERAIWSAGSNSTFALYFHTTDQLRVWVNNAEGAVQTKALFRDTSAWYHIALTSKNSGLFFELYVNGIKLIGDGDGASVDFSYDNRLVYPGGDTSQIEVNSNAIHYLGAWNNGGLQYFDGYLADVNFLDGITVGDTNGVLDEFIEIKNGVCIPKSYSGSYGTNGYRLEFKQTALNGGTGTASTVGADTSGRTNHYDSSGIDTYNSNMPDSPENNFATFNLVDLRHRAELVQGTLKVQATTYSTSGSGGGNFGFAFGTISLPSSGKFYIEALHRKHAGSGNSSSLGVMNRNQADVLGNVSNYFQADNTGGEGFDGIQLSHGSGDSSYFLSRNDGNEEYRATQDDETNHISALAIDIDNGYIYIGFNAGTDNTGSEITWRDFASNDTGSSNVNPTSAGSGTGGIARTFSLNDVIVSDVATNGGNSNKSSVTINFGQDSSFFGVTTAQGETDANGKGDFYYTVPSGYLALCTANLPETTISPNSNVLTQAVNHFGTLLYTGDGNNSRNIVSGGTNIDGEIAFTPDWVWIKRRDDTNSHVLVDSVRGKGSNDSLLALLSNDTGPDLDDDDHVRSLDSNGFTLDDDTDNTYATNNNNQTYIAWNWKGGGAPSADNSAGAGNTPTANSVKIDGSNLGSALAGSIPATRISANTTAGVSIVTYTGTGSAGTIAHGLGKKPAHIIFKSRTENGTSWANYVEELGAGKYLALQSTQAENAGTDTGRFNNTEPTTSVFSVGTHVAVNTSSSHKYVAYCFTEIEGFSKFGKFLGNASTDGTFIYTGFRPQLVIAKVSTATSAWHMVDADIDHNPVGYFNANEGIQYQDYAHYDLLSNGFKIRDNGTESNRSPGTIIYLAFAEVPFKYANAR